MAESAPASGGLRFTNAPEPVAGSIWVNQNAYAFFRFRFYEEELRRGILPFYVRDQVLDGLSWGTDLGALIATDLGASITITVQRRAKFDPNSPPPSYREYDYGLIQIDFQLILYT